MKADLTTELLQALLAASDERKQAALQVLKGVPASDAVHREPELFLSLKEIARVLNVHYTTLWKWRVPGHRWAGRPKYRISEVLAYLESEAFRGRVQELKTIRRRQRRWVRPDGKEA